MMVPSCSMAAFPLFIASVLYLCFCVFVIFPYISLDMYMHTSTSVLQYFKVCECALYVHSFFSVFYSFHIYV